METKEKKIIPASVQIPNINGGWLDAELGEAMSEAVRACLAHGKQAEVTLKLKITAQNISHGKRKTRRRHRFRHPRRQHPSRRPGARQIKP